MARLLDGRELQSYIKARQLRQVRNLRQEHRIIPKLALVADSSSGQVVDTYMRLKARYAEDVLVEVGAYKEPLGGLGDRLAELNSDESTQGVVLHLPLSDISATQPLCDLIDHAKDIDGLGHGAVYSSATAEAIDWLLAGYGIDLEGKKITIVGDGKLVGRPLAEIWRKRDLDLTVLDEDSVGIAETLRQSAIIVSATGVPNLIQADDIAPSAIVVDAGTASEGGVIVGDVAIAARERDDITITPVRGGVGPLTIAVLFDHLIQACYRQAGKL